MEVDHEFQEIARALGASTSARQAALVVAAGAARTFRAAGSHVELRVDQGDAPVARSAASADGDGQVEVLAVVGDGPPLGVRVPYPGSLSSTGMRSGETSLVVPLVADGYPQGALVLRRQPGDEPFTGADAARARALGDLAAMALRHTALDEALRESEERFRQIADNIHEFIWLSDAEFTRHFYVNAAYEQIWGRPRASLYANPASLLDGVHPDDRVRVTAALSGMLRGEYDIEFRVARPDGAVRWVSSRGVPVRNERGEICRIAGITEDITDRKAAEIARNKAMESRRRLLRGFTHDVKNPLGAADGFLALLAEGVRGELSPAQQESVGRARRSIRSALDLIGHLLELARAEAGQLEIRRVGTDVRELASELVEEFRAQAEAKRLALALEQPPELPMIETDPARVRQVLANLVSNAVKYTPSGGRLTVRVGARARGAAARPEDWVAIDVVDTGTGIAPDKQELLFQEFTRFDPGAAHGAGIGLAISQRVAEALGGEIGVESELGVGSTFTLWLPPRSPATGRTSP